MAEKTNDEINREHWTSSNLNGGKYIDDPEDRTNYLLSEIDRLREEINGTQPPGTTLDTISRTWWPPKPLTAEQERVLIAKGWRKGEAGAWHQGAMEA